VAIGRKNFMFTGSHCAAGRAVIIYSLIATAKNHGIDPFTYIKTLLSKIPNATQNELKEFLVTNWKES